MKTMADEFYSDTGSKPQSKLGAILAEEEKKSNTKQLEVVILVDHAPTHKCTIVVVIPNERL
jgi:hypothetical protein